MKGMFDIKTVVVLVTMLISVGSTTGIMHYRVNRLEADVVALELADTKMATKEGVEKLDEKLEKINERVVKLLINAGIQP